MCLPFKQIVVLLSLAALGAGIVMNETGANASQMASTAQRLLAQGKTEDLHSQFALSRAHLLRALALFRASGDRRGEAEALDEVGNADEGLGRFDAAFGEHQSAFALYGKLHDRLGLARAGKNLGDVNNELGRFGDALQLYQTALTSFRSLKNRGGEADALQGIAGVYDELGRYDEALNTNGEALALYHALKQRDDEADTLTQLGEVFEHVGRFEDALGAHERARGLYHDVGDPDGEAAALVDVGSDNEDLKRYAAALEFNAQALSLFRRIKDVDGEADADYGRGVLLEDVGRIAEARAVLQRSAMLFHSVGDRPGEAAVLGFLADAENRLGAYATARKTATRGASLASELAAPDALWEALRAAGAAESHLGLREAAIADYDRTIATIERLRSGLSVTERASYLQDKLSVYDEYVAYLLDLDRRFPGKGYDRRALEILERKESRTVLEQIARSAAQRFRGVPASIVTQDRVTQAALDAAHQALTRAGAGVAARARLNAATAQRRSFEIMVQRTYPEYYALLNPKPADVATLQRALHGDEALLEYDVLPEQSLLFVLLPHGLATFRLPGSAALAEAVARVRSHIDGMIQSLESGILPDRAISAEAADDVAPFASESAALYRLLLPEAAGALIAKRRLVIVPDGPLYDVPWEALVRSASNAAPSYLLEEHAISYAPSGSLLALVRAGAAAKRVQEPLLAFARPAYDDASASTRGGDYARLQYTALRSDADGRFGDLPGTAVEAEGVRAALNASADSVITGEDASKAHLLSLNASHRLGAYRFVLFATHAVLPNEITGIDQPALVLAHPARDGFLTMADVFSLTLQAELVALSACNTGEGTRTPGEGISGMTRAFLYAGTPAISVTLWEVDDQAAPQIMPAFFAGMAAGMAPSDALRAAKLKMLQSSDPRFRHPYAWAPMVIFGDGDTSRQAQ